MTGVRSVTKAIKDKEPQTLPLVTTCTKQQIKLDFYTKKSKKWFLAIFQNSNQEAQNNTLQQCSGML